MGAFHVWRVDERRRAMMAYESGGEREREIERERERERGGAGSTKKTLRVVLAGAPVKSLGSSEMLGFFSFFFFFFFSRGPAFAIWYSNAEETGGELLPDHPQNRQGLVKEHQLGQQDAGPVHVQGDVRQLTHTGVDLVLFTRVTRSLSLSHTHTHTHTHKCRALTQRQPRLCSDLFSHTLTVIQKQLQNSSWFSLFQSKWVWVKH